MRTYLITGANSGLGLETTRALAAKGHRIIMAVRDLQRGEHARDEILRQFPTAQLVLEHLDLLDLGSVSMLARKDLGVDVLINNAGIGSGPKRLSPQGILEQLATNHLGHFVLTGSMMEQLTTRRDARVVTVGSGFGKRGALDLGNLDGGRGYLALWAYVQSKLANSLFCAELDRRLRARRSPVKSILVHPGLTATPMQQKAKGLEGLFTRAISAVFARPAAHGALPTIEAATATTAQGGDVFGPGKAAFARPRKEKSWPSMADLDGGRRLWARSEELAGVKFL